MKGSFILVGMVAVLLLFSCSSSHSSNDSDIFPDFDFDSDNSENIVDDDSDSEEDSDFIEDSDETDDFDSDIEDPEEPDDGIFEKTEPINGYKRCYDKIPAEPYEGFFASSKLESQIKEDLGYDEDYELTEEDLEKIKEITFLSVKDIRGIEKLINLESVQISTGKIYDYTPLSKLKKLKKIVIDATSMTCLDGSISLLTTLETLNIEETKLKEVSPVEQLVNLKTLDLGNNQIEFLPENIENLQKLEFFSFVHNRVKDITALKFLTNLKELFFRNNYVEDISPLKDLINLTMLNVKHNGSVLNSVG